jgi:dienelactone hydrolase
MVRMTLAAVLFLFFPGVGFAKLVGKLVTYEQGGTPCEGYLAFDDAQEGKRPGVLVVHEWWGLNDYAKRRADMLAALGYVAFAGDMYGKIVTDDMKRAGELAGELTGKPDLLRERARAALDVLARDERVDARRLAAIGYCFGGTTALQLAFSGAPLAGVVSFHGALAPVQEKDRERVKADILVCTGGADPMVPLKDVEAFQKSLDGAGIHWDVIIYGGAKHSFTNADSDKMKQPGIGYDARADRASWAHMQVFFSDIFREDQPKEK